MEAAGRFRSVGLAVLAAGIVIGPAAVLAGGGSGAPEEVGGEDGRLPSEVPRSEQPDLELLGASGVLPTTRELPTGGVAPGDPVAVPGTIVIPPAVLDAYLRAERILALRMPDCGASWSLLAGVGRVVSDHARGGGLDERGTTLGPILGPSLDGSPGIAELPDTDAGRLDTDKAWDRAAGPMQIIPAVWQRVGADSDAEGSANPHNVYDAALAAGRYLCENDADLRTRDGQAQATFRYQRSEPFVRSTMRWTQVYDAAAPAPPGPDKVRALPPAEAVTLSDDPPPPEGLPSGPVSSPESALPEESAPPGSTPAPPAATRPPPDTTRPPGDAPDETTEPSEEPTEPPPEEEPTDDEGPDPSGESGS